MDTKRIITNKDAKAFFDTSLNSIEDGIGTAIFCKKTSMISFDFTTVLLLAFQDIYAQINYSINDNKLADQFGITFLSAIDKSITNKTTYKYQRRTIDGLKHFEIKLQDSEEEIILFILCIEKLVSTEKTLSSISNLTGAGQSMFVGNTWWIDYDYHAKHFYQSDNGPKILGVPLSKDKIYSTKEFSTVRENARKVSPFFDECISVEQANFEQVRHNKSDYFGGRTPALTVDGETIWVEAYGKCLLRYPDGSPRFFIAIDIYLSDITENLNQLNIINSLTDIGLINSNVGVWYYQKHFTEGRYFFTKSHREMMNLNLDYDANQISDELRVRYKKIVEAFPEYKGYVDNFFETHKKIFTGELDKYTLTLPNYTNQEHPRWIEIRGTVIQRGNDGAVILFVGVNVDITESFLREHELQRLKQQNERLQLAEKLAIKAGNVAVWYQDTTLLQEMKYIFGNETFYNKLGIKRDENGLIKVSQILNTMSKENPSDNKIRKNMISNLMNIYNYKTVGIHNIVSKHQNAETGEFVYFSNSVEVEEFNDAGKITLVGGIMVDVTETRKREERIRFLANHDVLSNLYNRNYFEQYISTKLPEKYSLCIFDLDGLKLINDAFGHLEGDRVIKVIASLLEETYINNYFIARIGGDEFVVLLDVVTVKEVAALFEVFDNKVVEYNKNSTIEINVSRAGIIASSNQDSFEKAFTAAENRMYKRKLNNRSSRKSKVLDSIIETLNQKTEETREHSDRLGLLAVQTMKELNMTRESEKEDILLLAKVHDIGKITIPDYILNKPGKLTVPEFEIIKKHCEAGYKIIKNITDSDPVSTGVLSHHENYDGSGYPQGLAGNDISIYARIISVVDAFDAMTSKRVYQAIKTPAEAIEELLLCSGTQFDPYIVNAFIRSYKQKKDA
jgi:diguanylate cyclase (GGDEF)-like protein